MKEVITIGVDLAKNVFQVHGVDAEGSVIVRRQLRRGQMLPFFKKQPPCLVGLEACATSHHWGREIEALGHQVRLMPPRYVKPYVKRNKNDMRLLLLKVVGSRPERRASPEADMPCFSARRSMARQTSACFNMSLFI